MTKILPAKPDDAVRKIIEIVKALNTITENESRHIAVRNEVAMGVTNADKDKLLSMYIQAAQEFRTRREEFRKADAALLDTLDKEQKTLAETAKGNQDMLDALRIQQ